jgi:hypothetical protein
VKAAAKLAERLASLTKGNGREIWLVVAADLRTKFQETAS